MSNEENEKNIWVKVHLSSDMHKRLKMMAAERGGTLQGLVVQILGDGIKVGGEVVGSADPVPTIRTQDTKTVNQTTPRKHSAYTA